MIEYNPETEFQTSGNLVYNLRLDGWRRGTPQMVNDVTVQVSGQKLSPEQITMITTFIQTALNTEFSVD